MILAYVNKGSLARELIIFMALLALLAGCSHGFGIDFTGGGSNPGRFYNSQQAINTTLNLADLLEAQEAQCAAGRQSEAANLVKQARAAAQDIETTITMFNDTPAAYDRVTTAIQAAAKVSRSVYYFCMSCGGIPPTIPNIPVYTETFWDIAS